MRDIFEKRVEVDKLHQFVEENLKKGVSPQEMKSHLLANGWRESEISDALDYASGRKAKKRIIYSLGGIIVVAILALVLVSMTKMDVPPVVTPPGNGTVNLKNTDTAEGCANKDYSIDKDECYKKFIVTGFDCETLEDNIEYTYCTRAYEETMLEDAEKSSENTT